MIIYKATNVINKKVYIGLTINSLNRRKGQHLYDAKNKTYNSIFHASIRKYGPENFKWETIRTAKNFNELSQFEIEEISNYKSNDPTFGYNLTEGGHTFPKDYIPKKRFGKDNPFYGKTHSDETKQLLKEINIGKYSGDKNYFYDKHFNGKQNHFYGKKHKDSTKKLVGEANSKYFKITTKDGNSTIIKNLHTFCIENNLIYHSVKLSSRFHKWHKKKYLIEQSDQFGNILEDKNLTERLKKYNDWHAKYRLEHHK